LEKTKKREKVVVVVEMCVGAFLGIATQQNIFLFMTEVTILHLSDTHGYHRSIESTFGLPSADILIHTGDFTEHGHDQEFQDFNEWLGEISDRYRHIIVITGNHEYKLACSQVRGDVIDPVSILDHDTFIKNRISNAVVLNQEAIQICGLTIYGLGWAPWHDSKCPENASSWDKGRNTLWTAYCSQEYRGVPSPHHYDSIPEGVDILLTHGPPYGIFDYIEGTSRRWGSSACLRDAIYRCKPKAHLFGHLHEQRGVWVRKESPLIDPTDNVYVGGVEYVYPSDMDYTVSAPPPRDYPCALVSCNAMLNHARLENAPRGIVGPGRLIIARKDGEQQKDWSFCAV
jgi:Icc-related predicted phosphoesterase